MKEIRPYRVTFLAKMDGQTRWRVDVEAYNAPEAEKKVAARWGAAHNERGKKPQMFDVTVRRLGEDEPFQPRFTREV